MLGTEFPKSGPFRNIGFFCNGFSASWKFAKWLHWERYFSRSNFSGLLGPWPEKKTIFLGPNFAKKISFFSVHFWTEKFMFFYRSNLKCKFGSCCIRLLYLLQDKDAKIEKSRHFVHSVIAYRKCMWNNGFFRCSSYMR